jgi:tetratricopeptide (TPR) repeat protein
MMIWRRREGVTVIHTRAYAAEGGLAYAPIVELLATEAMQRALQRLDPLWLGEIARLQPHLFERFPTLPKLAATPEQWQRQRLFEALARLFTLEKRPLLIVLDDLQWFDHETLEWLHYLLRFDRRARLLIIATLRAEEIDEDHPAARLLLALTAAGQSSEIALAPLDAAATVDLANSIAEHPFDRADANDIYRASEGNPLFVIETVHANLHTLPPKVQALIQTRLAQLSPAARNLAQVAALIGRSFSADLLVAAAVEAHEQGSQQREAAILHALDELGRRRIVREQEGFGDSLGYDFSHDRIREVAAAHISKARSSLLHRHIAAALERLHAPDLGPVSAQLAVHYEAAGLVTAAISFYWQAAQIAEQRFARGDEVGYLEKALALLDNLPPRVERSRLRLDLTIALAIALASVRGPDSPEVLRVYQEAIALSRQLGNAAQEYIAQRGLWQHHLNRAELPAMHAVAAVMLPLAQAIQDHHPLFDAYFAIGHTYMVEGEFTLAEQTLAQAKAYESLSTPPAQHTFVPIGLGALRTLIQANMLWHLGYVDQARSLRDQAMLLLASPTNPFTRLPTLYNAALVAINLGESERVAALAAEMADLSAKFGDPFYVLDALVFGDWAAAQLTQDGAAVERLCQTLPQYQRANHLLFLPLYYALLAEACLVSGQLAQGSAAIEQALLVSQQTGEGYRLAELHRLAGELRLAQGASPTEAEACFAQALAIARRQKARSLELRAALSLARLRQRQGQQSHAYHLLHDIYSQFSEGFDSADLTAARELLAQLS